MGERMTKDQLELLLSVARLLRAQMRDELHGGVLLFNREADLRDLDDALAPFAALPTIDAAAQSVGAAQ
jgi:hypothetical protein